VATIGVTDTPTAVSARAEDMELVRDALDALTKSVSEACRLGDRSSDLVVGDRDKCLGVWIGTSEPR